MKLHHTQNVRGQQITGYGEGFIKVNGIIYEGNVIVTTVGVSSWPVANFAALSEADFTSLLIFQPDVILLGTGETLRFPSPKLIQKVTQQQIGVEAMDIGAACRTFNVLIEEGRQVVMAVVYS